MKQPKYTAAPIVGEPESPFSLKSLFTGHRRSTRYYEGRDAEGTLYLLWMEYTRFGVLLAYPCVLAEDGVAPMCFDASGDPAADDKNERLLSRWETLSLPDRRDSLEIRALKEKEFKELFRKVRSGTAG